MEIFNPENVKLIIVKHQVSNHRAVLGWKCADFPLYLGNLAWEEVWYQSRKGEKAQPHPLGTENSWAAMATDARCIQGRHGACRQLLNARTLGLGEQEENKNGREKKKRTC